MAELQDRLAAYSQRAPGHVALQVADLATGFTTGVNAGVEMPAASTIKVPVMVEVFRQLAMGRFDLNSRVTLRGSDKDWGSGDLCDAPAGAAYPVSRLLALMIDDSDNTATNMLMRLVGRQTINTTMRGLGLTHTKIADFIRSNGPIRSALRSTPADMVHLLTAMAKQRLIDEWSSRQMVAILAADHINTLLPVPLPRGTTIAHKTGSLRDTLNDVGIVYPSDPAQSPYVIAVMTTALPTLSAGRAFIRGVSKMAYDALARVETIRDDMEPPAPVLSTTQTENPDRAAPRSPDERMWNPPQTDDGAAPAPLP